MKTLDAMIAYLFVLGGCAMAHAAELGVKSQPSEADIYIMNLRGDKSSKIGKTPFQSSVEQLADNYVQSEVFVIEVRKDGFATKSYVLTKLIPADIDLFVTLESSSDLPVMRNFDALTTKLFETQRMIRGKQYGEAITILEAERSKFPLLSILPEMLGSAYYLQGNYSAALESLKTALSNNPQNTDALKLKLLIEKKTNVKDLSSEARKP